MKKIQKYLLIFGVLVAIPLATPVLFANNSAYAARCIDASGNAIKNCCVDGHGQEVITSVIDCSSVAQGGKNIIWTILTIAVNFLAAGVGIVVVAGIVFGAITYATAAGSAEQAKKGIGFVRNAVIALLLFIFMYAIINFLVPGGLF